MPPTKGPLWDHFLAGTKQNGSHIRAHCHGCIERKRPAGDIVEYDENGNPKLVSTNAWVVEGKPHSSYYRHTQSGFLVEQHAKMVL